MHCRSVVILERTRVPGTAAVNPYVGFKGDITSRNTVSCLLNYFVSILEHWAKFRTERIII